ncbi:MAG TPA: 2-C-methyl-D-erythritol 4-phosphate cytidylyltransferase [Thiotrichales bacterium]|nr:2-C-methyl-D-erythritol 4-phosphate cytidylyltransferase [Thiotrichales bacterium]
MIPFHVVIPAAGAGRRMGAPLPKQYLPLRGATVLQQTVARFHGLAGLRSVTIAVSASDDRFDTLLFPIAVRRVEGGEERCHSVLNALRALAVEGVAEDAWVMVHDAARPCVRRQDLLALAEAVAGHPCGGLLAVPVRDTMKRSDERGDVARTEPREGLWHALTPQMFRLGPLRRALEAALAEGLLVTDEASAMEHAGHRPRLVRGHADNLKITLPEDLALAEFHLARLEEAP